MKDIDIKSLLSSLGFILAYIYATVGIVKLCWNTDDNYKFEGRVKFLILSSILFSLLYIFGMYYIVGHYNIGPFYKAFLIGQAIYVVIGIFANLLIKKPN
jgi:hypothetical protein